MIKKINKDNIQLLYKMVIFIGIKEYKISNNK